MFFIFRSRFDDMLREKSTQIGYRDRRIAELEAERRMLWDKICLLGIGAPVFDGINASRSDDPRHGGTGPVMGRSGDPENVQDLESQSASHSSVKPEVGIHHRPSMIMRRMDRLAEERWLRKVRPARVAEQQRDEVMTELNTAHMDGLKAATSNFKNG